MSYVFTIWHKFRPLGVSESVTYPTHLADEVRQRQNFCRRWENLFLELRRYQVWNLQWWALKR
jgi:hypothetical protein